MSIDLCVHGFKWMNTYGNEIDRLVIGTTKDCECSPSASVVGFVLRLIMIHIEWTELSVICIESITWCASFNPIQDQVFTTHCRVGILICWIHPHFLSCSMYTILDKKRFWSMCKKEKLYKIITNCEGRFEPHVRKPRRFVPTPSILKKWLRMNLTVKSAASRRCIFQTLYARHGLLVRSINSVPSSSSD